MPENKVPLFKTNLIIFALLVIALALFTGRAAVSGSPTAGSAVYLPILAKPYPRVAGEPAVAVQNDLVFFETFDGDPAAPEVWTDENWDITIHQRDQDRLYEMMEMPAHHGPNCEPPPATHNITTHEENLYICKNHMMTANYGVSKNGGYGLVYFAPNQTIDTTDDWFIKFDMSTYRVNPARNWIDIWIVPFDQNLQLAIHEFDPDLQGAPLEGIQIRLRQENLFRVTVHENGNETNLPLNRYTEYDQVLSNYRSDPVYHMKNRSTFYFGVLNGRLKVGLPEHNLWWHDQPAPPIFSRPDWKTAAVQFGHHSYTPDKMCEFSPFSAACNQHGADTFHWDNIMMFPVKQFEMIHGTPRLITTSTAIKTFTADQPSPAGSYVRFAGIGENLEISTNGGSSWQTPTEQAHSKTKQNGHFRSYWHPIPAGTTEILFRGENWHGGQHEWATRDISIWALSD